MALGAAVFQQIVQTQPDVDAVFFCNDDLAQGALLAATRMGIKIPERLAIAGFNDLTGSDQMVPALTTVRTPRAEIGTVAASMLLNLIKGAAVASTCVDLGYALQVRESS
jgi:LacI family gluconate utilization system Gnt-I transcriptional repressor